MRLPLAAAPGRHMFNMAHVFRESCRASNHLCCLFFVEGKGHPDGSYGVPWPPGGWSTNARDSRRLVGAKSPLTLCTRPPARRCGQLRYGYCYCFLYISILLGSSRVWNPSLSTLHGRLPSVKGLSRPAHLQRLPHSHTRCWLKIRMRSDRSP